MDLVLDYEQRSHTALARLLGRSWTSADLLFHAACAAAVLCAGAIHARLPVLLAWLCNHLLERFLLGACSPLLSLNSEGQVQPQAPYTLLPKRWFMYLGLTQYGPDSHMQRLLLQLLARVR